MVSAKETLIPIEAIAYDLEGPAIDSPATVWRPSDDEFFAWLGRPCPPELLERIVGTTVPDGTRIIRDYLGLEAGFGELLAKRYEIIDGHFRNGMALTTGFLAFHASHPEWPSAIATALVSQYLSQVRERFGLDELFQGHVYSVEGTGLRSKPAPDIFLYAAARLGVLPENVLVIEDAPNGIEAARRAGMRSVGITTTFRAERLKDATMVVDSYDRIDLAALERLPLPEN